MPSLLVTSPWSWGTFGAVGSRPDRGASSPRGVALEVAAQCRIGEGDHVLDRDACRMSTAARTGPRTSSARQLDDLPDPGVLPGQIPSQRDVRDGLPQLATHPHQVDHRAGLASTPGPARPAPRRPGPHRARTSPDPRRTPPPADNRSWAARFGAVPRSVPPTAVRRSGHARTQPTADRPPPGALAGTRQQVRIRRERGIRPTEGAARQLDVGSRVSGRVELTRVHSGRARLTGGEGRTRPPPRRAWSAA